MNTSKLFGIGIILMFAVISASAVNDAALESLLSNYDLSYSDGSFDVQFAGSSMKYADGSSEAGSVDLNYTVTGSGSYIIKAKVRVTNTNATDNGIINYYEIPEMSETTPGLKTITLDGKYFFCERAGYYASVEDNNFDTDFTIIKDGAIAFQKTIRTTSPCSATPIQSYSNFGLTGIVGTDADSDTKYEGVTATLEFLFPEAGTYNIRVYLTDNQTAAAYADATAVATGNEVQDVSFYFDADKFKYFNLSNDYLLVKSIYVNGHKIEDIVGKDYSPEGETFRYSEWYQDTGYNPILFSNSDFYFDEVYADSYAFVKSESDDKITELIANVNMNAVSGTYSVEASLVNDAGEFVDVVSTTVSSNGVLSIPFNGTHIYESKVNGPYKLGYLKVYSGDTTYYYVENKGTTQLLSSYNFTAPLLPDVLVDDSMMSITGDDIDVSVQNIGTTDAMGVVVSLYDSNANKVDEYMVDKIPQGSAYVVTFMDTGLTSAIVVADFKNQIEELNESNNIGTLAGTLQSDIAVFAYIYNKNQKEYNALNVPINANVSFDSVTRQAFITEEPAMFDLSVDAVHTIDASSDGFNSISGQFFFDQRLFTCSEGSGCSFVSTLNTNCNWESISWLCSLSNGMSFRLYNNPTRVKISGYLVEN